MNIKRLDVIRVETRKNGSIQGGERYGVVVSNDRANEYSPVIHIIPTTTEKKRMHLPTHTVVKGFGLPKESVLLGEQVMPVNKRDILEVVGYVNDIKTIEEINNIIKVQLALC